MTGNDWIKTGKKFLWVAAEIVVAGTIVYFTETPGFLILVPVFEVLRNYLKHRKDL